MPIFIVAEIGINHNGDMNICKELIDLAVESGCDAVKFQKRSIDKVYTQEYLNSKRESPWGDTQRAQKEALEFSFDDYKIIDYSNFNSNDNIKDANIAATLLKVQERKTAKGNAYAVIKLTDLTSVFDLCLDKP